MASLDGAAWCLQVCERERVRALQEGCGGGMLCMRRQGTCVMTYYLNDRYNEHACCYRMHNAIDMIEIMVSCQSCSRGDQAFVSSYVHVINAHDKHHITLLC